MIVLVDVLRISNGCFSGNFDAILWTPSPVYLYRGVAKLFNLLVPLLHFSIFSTKDVRHELAVTGWFFLIRGTFGGLVLGREKQGILFTGVVFQTFTVNLWLHKPCTVFILEHSRTQHRTKPHSLRTAGTYTKNPSTHFIRNITQVVRALLKRTIVDRVLCPVRHYAIGQIILVAHAFFHSQIQFFILVAIIPFDKRNRPK